MRILFSFLFLLFTITVYPQKVTVPQQALQGPGGQEYLHASVQMYDFADKTDGYWLFEPADPVPRTANVVVFNHGYGAYNPMIYAGWIKHLVRKGNVVIFPRYQRNLVATRTGKFADNAAQAIKDGLEELQNGKHPKPTMDAFCLVGHSYGAVVCGELAASYEAFEIPQPKGILMCSPGTGPLKGGRLDSYAGIPTDSKLIIMTTANDYVVGDEFAWLVFGTASNTEDRNLIQQFPDDKGRPRIRAGHNECYSLEDDFDTGVRNVTAKRALRTSTIDALDYNGYWKIMDAMLSCIAKGEDCEFALGNTPEQRNLGTWSVGTPIRPLNVIVPKIE